MKKIIGIALAIMLVPFTAFGLEMISDEAMDQVTGQAGVSIVVDDVELYLDIEKISWVDTDGVAGNDAAGFVLENLHMENLALNAIGAGDGYKLNDGSDITFSALTIDATSSLPLLGVTGVKVGLPTVEVTIPGMYVDSTIADFADTDGDGRFEMVGGSQASFGQLYIGNQTMAVLKGTVEIAPH